MNRALSTLHAAIVVVREGDKYVFVEEAKEGCEGQWALPGGVLEAGEHFLAAAVREVKEEAGLDVEPLGLLALEHRSFAGGDPYDLKVRYIVAAKIVGGALKTKADAESRRAVLVTMDEARRLSLRDGVYLEWLRLGEAANSLLPLAACRVFRG